MNDLDSTNSMNAPINQEGDYSMPEATAPAEKLQIPVTFKIGNPWALQRIKDDLDYVVGVRDRLQTVKANCEFFIRNERGISQQQVDLELANIRDAGNIDGSKILWLKLYSELRISAFEEANKYIPHSFGYLDDTNESKKLYVDVPRELLKEIIPWASACVIAFNDLTFDAVLRRVCEKLWESMDFNPGATRSQDDYSPTGKWFQHSIDIEYDEASFTLRISQSHYLDC